MNINPKTCNFRCPDCGSDLHFDVRISKYVCENKDCGAIYTTKLNTDIGVQITRRWVRVELSDEDKEYLK